MKKNFTETLQSLLAVCEDGDLLGMAMVGAVVILSPVLLPLALIGCIAKALINKIID